MPKNPLQTRSTNDLRGVRALRMQYVRSHQYMSSRDWRNSFRFWGLLTTTIITTTTATHRKLQWKIASDAEVSQSQSQSKSKSENFGAEPIERTMSPVARDLQNVTFDLDLITWQNVEPKCEKCSQNK